MNEFAYELIRENKIKFQSGNFFMLGFPNNLITLTNATTFFHILKLKYGKAVDDIIRNVAKRQIKAMAYVLFNSIKNMNSEKLDLLLKHLNLFGYGSITIANTNYKLKEMAFQIKNSTLCLMHLKLFDIKNRPENAFVEGICAGIAEMIFNCRMTAKETDCVAMKKECCFIIASKNLEKEKNPVLDKYDITMLKMLKQRKLDNTQAELIKKVAGHNMIEWNKGNFILMGLSGVIIPTPTLIFLTKALEEECGKEANHMLYHIARVQSRVAVYFQVKQFGFKKDVQLLKSILQHSDMTGFGVVKLIKADFGNHEISVQHFYNPYSFYIKELFGKTNNSVDHYSSGLLAGTAESFFDSPVGDVETKCVAKGDEYCLHESSTKHFETSFPLEKEYIKIIEEKVVPKNFIL
jgi:predicted hydrocarbon binding protein